MEAHHSLIQDATLWFENRIDESENEAFDLGLILKDFLSRWRLLDVIDAFTENPDQLYELSKRSYRHCNGFDRIQLLPLASVEYGLRLHIWWGDDNVPKERVHSHPWNFASRVLIGELNFEQFIDSHSGKIVEVSEYSRPDGQSTYQLTPSGTRRLRPVLSGSMPAGTSYYADHELLHRVWTSPDQSTATLMLHGRGIAYPSRVFFPMDSKAEIGKRYRRENPNVESLRITLRRARLLLENRTP